MPHAPRPAGPVVLAVAPEDLTRLLHEKISRDLSLASPRLDALTDLTDVPELLTLGAMPQYEARWSWSGNLAMSTDTASCAAVLGPTPGTVSRHA